MHFMGILFRKNKRKSRGGILEMLDIATPIVISQACYTLMIFTDRLFLSRLGPEMMNASMAGGLTSFMMITFFLGITSYTTALVAQYYGAGRKGNCALPSIRLLL